MAELWPGYEAEQERREVMRRCRVTGWRLYQEHGILSHERVARQMGDFLATRITDEAVLTIVEHEVGIATYLSCGQKAIAHALGLLVRLAWDFDADPEYRDEWRPDGVAPVAGVAGGSEATPQKDLGEVRDGG